MKGAMLIQLTGGLKYASTMHSNGGICRGRQDLREGDKQNQKANIISRQSPIAT